jgi:imidazolonepropionase-like amidohydrolase
LEVGKRADVLVLGANPLADIHNIEKLELVLHHGYVINPSGAVLSERTP